MCRTDYSRDALVLCTLIRPILRSTNTVSSSNNLASLHALGSSLATCLGDCVRMLQQDPRVQPFLQRRRRRLLSCVVVCSACRFRLNTVSQCRYVLRKMPLVASRTLFPQQEQTFVNVETAFDRPIEHAYCAWQNYMKYDRLSVHQLASIKLRTSSLPALLSGLAKVCISFVVDRTGRSAIHGRCSLFKFVSFLFKDPTLVSRWRPPIGVRRRERVLSNHIERQRGI